jgi:hypothetical protein
MAIHEGILAAVSRKHWQDRIDREKIIQQSNCPSPVPAGSVKPESKT